MPNRHAGVRAVPVLILAILIVAAPPAAPARADECPDALITAGVKTRLAADDLTGVFKINVDTEECVVTLNGCVESNAHVKRAKKLAARVAKVKAVKSNLTICPKQD
jgi:hypothetical protein